MKTMYECMKTQIDDFIIRIHNMSELDPIEKVALLWYIKRQVEVEGTILCYDKFRRKE